MNDQLFEDVPWQHHDNRLRHVRLLREPTSLDAFDSRTFRNIVICRENRTFIFIGEGRFPLINEGHVFFEISGKDNYTIVGAIYGTTDAAIAETATFFWSLKHPEGTGGRLYARAYNGFRCDAFTPEQLVRILDANPTRRLSLSTGVWSAQQSVILATRPYLLNLDLKQPHSGSAGFEFEDGGTAFVNALEERPSIFGSLRIDVGANQTASSRANLKRLFKLEEIFNYLSICIKMEGIAFLYSIKTQMKTYVVSGAFIPPQVFDTFHIPEKKLRFILKYFHDVDNWDAMLISFLNRVAQLGHFEILCISVDYLDKENIERYAFERVARVAEALICAVKANPNLHHLDLSITHHFLNFGPHLQHLFKAMEERKTPLAITISAYPLNEDPDYLWLKQLLSRNQQIAVFDSSRRRITDGSTIVKLYALNLLYHISRNFVRESPQVRLWAVGTALVESESGNFQSTALLLSDHKDVLCEWMIHNMNNEECRDMMKSV